MSSLAIHPDYKAKDYKTDLKPVWCPGCGDFGVLNAFYQSLAQINVDPWNTVVVSGIGCSSRFPGYVQTYGFNGVHGRALPLAMGAKVARPELLVVAVGGDGDGLAIGGNHFMHACRRNLDITYIIMDNEIYGLTKGQAAPTTPDGDMTKSTFYGNPEPKLDACELAISCGATWVGRGFSSDKKYLVDLMVKAMRHPGFSFLDVVSPCVTFRGDHQFKEIKGKLAHIPEDHDHKSRRAALKYTREHDRGVLTAGVLYEVEKPTLDKRLADIRKMAMGDAEAPTTKEIIESFYPSF